LVLYLTVAEI